MRVLVVEDSDARVLAFQCVFSNDDVWFARDVAQAVRLLARRTYDLVCLDHDLEPPERGVNGQYVARLITHLRRAPAVLIHSWNRPGALAISRILGADVEWMIAPFGATTADDIRALMERTAWDAVFGGKVADDV